MHRSPFPVLLASIVALNGALRPLPAAPPTASSIREPAVAGLFYPRQTDVLAATVDRLLTAASSERSGALKALICPHAGYAYSGPVAASGFRLLRGTAYRTVVLLGPAHYALLDAAEVSDAAAFRTPLGDVPISAAAGQLGRSAPFEQHPRVKVDRPAWAPGSRSNPPLPGDERADTWEHADEVELPFLQRTLGPFSLVPVVMGDVDPAAAAKALLPLLTDDTLLIVSSDLSHYHPYADAQKRDRDCVDAVCALDIPRMARAEACGRIPILTLLHIARQQGWEPRLLDLRNSGDTAGDKSRVVGYAAIAFYERADSPLAASDRTALLGLARAAVREAAETGRRPAIPPRLATGPLATPKGVFVTLTRKGDLRGCIGTLNAALPLYRAVTENARSAALHDPRFPAVRPAEVPGLTIEISVLSPPEPLSFVSPDDLLRKLQPHRDGVVLHIAAGTATYLPQVWEQISDRQEFLDSLAEKAGGSAGDWRQRDARVEIYHVESFAEPSR